MNYLHLALLIGLIPWLSGCGGNAEAARAHHQPSDAFEDESSSEHVLSVTVDGVRFEARGRLFGPSILFGGREINVQVGGPLVSAVAARHPVSLGDYDLPMNLLANGVAPGDYSIVSNRNRVARSSEPLGFAEIFFPESETFGMLRPKSGTLTVDSVEGNEDSGRYQLRQASGHGSGQFTDEEGAEHSVEYEFTYRR